MKFLATPLVIRVGLVGLGLGLGLYAGFSGTVVVVDC